MGFLEKAVNAFGIKTAEQKAAEAALAKKRMAETSKKELQRLRKLGIVEGPIEPEPLHAATYTTTARPEVAKPASRGEGADEFTTFEKISNREAKPITWEEAFARDEKAKEIEKKTRQERERNAQLAGKLVDYFNTHKDEEYEPGKIFGKNLEKLAEKLLLENDPELMTATEALYPQYVREQALFDAAVAGHTIEQHDKENFSYFADKAMILTKLQKTLPKYN